MDTRALFDLTGRVALVTGAGRGIGRAIAETLSAAGAALVLSDIVEDGVSELASSMTSAGKQAMWVKADVSSDSDVGATVTAAIERFWSIDILVNNAGAISHNNILETPPDEWNRIMEINLGGTMRYCRAVAPLMRSKGWGRIINLGSSFSAAPTVLNKRGGGADYCLAKATIQNFAKLLAFELAPHHVTVNCIAPGIVDTPMHTRGGQAMQEKYAPLIPIGRLAQPQDVANVALFLASNAAEYVTGQVLHVNGGMLMAG